MTDFRLALCCAALLSLLPTAQAQFAIAISPPRFELSAKPGERLRQVIEITNAAARPTTLLVRTADWQFQPDDSVVFQDALQPGSCRPWVAIERRELTVAPSQPYRFRFEIAPPADEAPRECRFAIMLESKEATASPGSAGIPVAGRMGVIVYLGVGGVKPDLQVVSAALVTRNNTPAVGLQMRNGGDAHGRLDGFVTATDASGRTYEATPASTPILPGETRQVLLSLQVRGAPPGSTPPAPTLPLTLKGKLEWGKGQSTPVDLRIGP